MKSMTGYGRGESSNGGYKFTVELNSVNRKQSDISINLPRELVELEPRIRDEINTVVSRGRLNVVIAYHQGTNRSLQHVEIDQVLAKVYYKTMQKLKKDLKLRDAITLETLIRAPGVIKLSETEMDPEKAWDHISKALKQALSNLVKMREKEGRYLKEDLVSRLKSLQMGVQQIQQLAPQVVKRYQQQLQERIKNSGVELPINDERLLKEVILFADRSDITEELTRLHSHFQQFTDCLNSREPVGRTLDFLTQEMNREINTIGSKANDAFIVKEVVALKAEIEKIREQVQNVE